MGKYLYTIAASLKKDTHVEPYNTYVFEYNVGHYTSDKIPKYMGIKDS
jgi:hypothetical protein